MNRLEIDKDRCKACRLCIATCNFKLLALADELNAKGFQPMAVRGDPSKCTACTLCATVCPEGAITVYRQVKVKETP